MGNESIQICRCTESRQSMGFIDERVDEMVKCEPFREEKRSDERRVQGKRGRDKSVSANRSSVTRSFIHVDKCHPLSPFFHPDRVIR